VLLLSADAGAEAAAKSEAVNTSTYAESNQTQEAKAEPQGTNGRQEDGEEAIGTMRGLISIGNAPFVTRGGSVIFGSKSPAHRSAVRQRNGHRIFPFVTPTATSCN
jgi:hypothetical protein